MSEHKIWQRVYRGRADHPPIRSSPMTNPSVPLVPTKELTAAQRFLRTLGQTLVAGAAAIAPVAAAAGIPAEKAAAVTGIVGVGVALVSAVQNFLEHIAAINRP